jgi:hypothetical protein
MHKFVYTFFVLVLATCTHAQIVASNAYLIGNYVEIGLDDGGFEGADTLLGSVPGIHFRSNSGNLFGFVADPNQTAWSQFDGDYFTPGSPENGWGLQIDNFANYSNNGANFGTDDFTGVFRNYVDNVNCLSVDWEGQTSSSGYDVSVKLQYTLLKNETFYKTKVKIINNGTNQLDSVYYYRNIDPDNNVELNGDYSTQNTIVNAYAPNCSRSLVSASQSTPWYSFIGLGATDTNVRVSYGGFANRSPKAIWHAGSGLTALEGAQGATDLADDAISLAHRTPVIAIGDSVEFEFLIILDSSAVDAAFASLYDIRLDSTDLCLQGNIVDTMRIFCPGNSVYISVSGADVGAFDWNWTPAAGLDVSTGPSVVASPGVSTLYTASGSTPGTCANSVAKLVYVEVSPNGPLADWTDPGYQCDSFDLSLLAISDLNAIPNTITTYHSVMPDSISDFSDTIAPGMLYPGDSVWVMIGDTSASDCYNVQLINISFSQLELDTVSIIPACNGISDGSIEVVANGSAPGVVYDIGFITQSIGLFSPLTIGTYTIYATDISGCIDSLTATVVAAAQIVLDSVSTTSPLCPGASDGQIEIIASGGTGGLMYSNNGGTTYQTSGIFTGLTAGVQTVIVIDTIGCQLVVDSMLTDPDEIDLSAVVTDAISGSDGAIDLTITGGTPSYVIDWDNDGVGDFDDNEDLSGLTPGTYFVIVIDAYGCSDTLTAIVGIDLGTGSELNETILIFPNPLEKLLTVRSGSTMKGEFLLVDALGRVVWESAVANPRKVYNLDVTQLESGIYVLSYYAEGKRLWFRKLIKE